MGTLLISAAPYETREIKADHSGTKVVSFPERNLAEDFCHFTKRSDGFSEWKLKLNSSHNFCCEDWNVWIKKTISLTDINDRILPNWCPAHSINIKMLHCKRIRDIYWAIRIYPSDGVWWGSVEALTTSLIDPMCIKTEPDIGFIHQNSARNTFPTNAALYIATYAQDLLNLTVS